MSDGTSIRGGQPGLGTHVDEEVSGEETFAEKTKREEREAEQNTPDREFEPASEQEVYEAAENAKADFAQASGGQTPEPTDDEQVPPARERAQERVGEARRSE